MKLLTPSGSYQLERIPQTNKGDLRAWDAADELLLHTIYENHHLTLNELSNTNSPLLIINDSFGALSLSLHQFKIHNWSDSYLSHLVIQNNIESNKLKTTIEYIASTDGLKQTYKFVFIKIPKSLALLEEQLIHLKPHITKDSKIIASAMSRHIHTSTIKLFENIIGTTTTSRAVKKARLIFTENNLDQQRQSPYPKVITDDSLQIQLHNHANVFAKDHLDIGTRFLIQQLKKCPSSKHIIDLGCGNGALGIMVQRYQPRADLHFIDESYMAIASSKHNYQIENPTTKASYTISNCLTHYTNEKPDLILCNPPFHQAHSMGDQIAWEMFKQSYEILKKGGELWIIGNRHLAYHVKLKRIFGNCKIIATNKKFVVLASLK